MTEICTVSGLHPAFTAQSYFDVYRWISEAAPGVHLHAGNPMEVAYAARKSGMTTKEVLSQMKAAGLNSDVRDGGRDPSGYDPGENCPQKISTEEWMRIIREAHHLGIPTTATIMYGHCESEKDG